MIIGRKDFFAKRDRIAKERRRPLRIFTPSPPPDIPSSVTNSPPYTIQRVNKLNLRLLDDVEKLENLYHDFKRHIQRSMKANTFLSQQLDLVKESLKTSQFHKSAANQPRNGKSLLGTRGSALSPICANRMMVKRQDAEAIRLQARQAKALEAQSQAQLARDLAEAEHEASMAARGSSGGNWYIDTTGGYL